MALDQSAFLLMTGALAAGGAGGYYAHQQGWIGHDKSAETVTVVQPVANPDEARTDAGTLSAANAPPVQSVEPVMAAAPLPLCDDSQGTPGDCPAPGMPTDEGGCGAFITTRCKDFKTSLKPRVAEVAVNCLRELKANERCDKNRVNLCGHLALTNACIEPEPVSTGVSATASAAAAATPPAPGSVVAMCDSIIKAAGTSRTGPTLADCRQTLSGMNETGRTRMLECMKKNWSTKGLLGCEAIDPAKPG